MCISARVYAAYDPSDPFITYVEFGLKTDSNVFGIGSVTPTTFSGRKDTLVFDSAAGLHYDYTASRQHFLVDADVYRTDFQKFSQVNYNGWHKSGTWNWAAGDQVLGSLKYADNRDLTEFNQLSLGQGDITRQRAWDWSSTYSMNAGLAFLLNADRQFFRHNQLNYLDANANTYGVGLAWTSNKGTSIILRDDFLKVDYQQDLLFLSAADRGYKLSAPAIELIEPITDALKFDTNLARATTTQNVSQSKGATVIWGTSATWQATGKTKLIANYQRRFSPLGADTSNTLTTTRSIEYSWQYSEKLSLDIQHYKTDSDYTEFSLGGARQEHISDYHATADWQLTKAIDIKLYGDHTTRMSTLAANAYSRNQAGLKLRLNY